MELNLDLSDIIEDDRLPFCEYIEKILRKLIYESGEQLRYTDMEIYIRDNNIIKWIGNPKQIISVYDLYRLAVDNLKIKEINKDNYQIRADNNVNIPFAYTNLYSIISLLEYGTLSIRKCGTLTSIMELIADNLTNYYNQFLMERNK